MTVKIEFETSNAAFENSVEIIRILYGVAEDIESGYIAGNIRDINGNKVGTYEYKR